MPRLAKLTAKSETKASHLSYHRCVRFVGERLTMNSSASGSHHAPLVHLGMCNTLRCSQSNCQRFEKDAFFSLLEEHTLQTLTSCAHSRLLDLRRKRYRAERFPLADDISNGGHIPPQGEMLLLGMNDPPPRDDVVGIPNRSPRLHNRMD